MYGLPVYVKEGLPFTRDLCLENSATSYLCFQMAYFTQCLTFFPSIDHLLHLCAWFLILLHLRKMRFYPSTQLLMFLFLENLTFIVRTGLPILVEMINLVNSVIIFSNDISELANFSTCISDCVSHSLLYLFLFSDASICSTMAFPSLILSSSCF